jgi:hypothetical protein
LSLWILFDDVSFSCRDFSLVFTMGSVALSHCLSHL